MEIQSIPFSEYQQVKINSVQDIFEDSVERINESSHQENCPRLPAPSVLNGSISFVTENLILTSAANVNQTLLERLGVTCIINAAPELPDTPYLDNRNYKNTINYYKVDVIDSSNSRICPHFDLVADLIHQNTSKPHGRTLVYCVAGVSRSSSLCLAYLMKYVDNMSLLEAYNYLKARRPRIKPNCGFFKQLIEYEKVLTGTSTVKMIYNEFVQMDIPEVYDSEYRVVRNFSKKHRVRC